MRGGRAAPYVTGLVFGLALAGVLSCRSPAAAAELESSKLVVVFYPHESDGAPGIILVNRAIRATFAGQPPGSIEIRNEYVDATRLRDAEFMQAQVSLLKRKYAGRKVDLVIAGLSAGLDFALAIRGEVFPSVPIVFTLVDEREVKARHLPPDVIGVPIRVDLAGTLDLALRLRPDTHRVFVIAGSSAFDAKWEAEARRVFGPYEGRLEFVYLTGLPMDELLGRVANLPEQSIVYYLHIFTDSTGRGFIPAEALERLAARANAPIFSHVDTFIDRGAIGGHAYVHEAEGRNAAQLGLRVLAGERPEVVPVPEVSDNRYLFDWRQLRRWGVSEPSLPPGSIIRHKEPTVWDNYKWLMIGGATLCLVQAGLIAGLMVQRVRWQRAEEGLRGSREDLQILTGRLLQAQETERRRIARELHDDLNQSLALLALELDLLGQDSPISAVEVADRMHEMSDRVKELSSMVHDLSHRLHPSKLEQLGLVAALGGLCRELHQCHSLEVDYTHHLEPMAIPPDAVLCLYRIAQEALQNVVKHSGSRRAVVELSGTMDRIRLRICDDGVGFDPDAEDGGSGLGLLSMRERLILVGGEIAIDSHPSGGTRIEVQIPVTDSDRAADDALLANRTGG